MIAVGPAVWDIKRNSSGGMQRLAPYSGRYQEHEFLGEAKCHRNLGQIATASFAVATLRIKYHPDSRRSAAKWTSRLSQNLINAFAVTSGVFSLPGQARDVTTPTIALPAEPGFF